MHRHTHLHTRNHPHTQEWEHAAEQYQLINEAGSVLMDETLRTEWLSEFTLFDQIRNAPHNRFFSGPRSLAEKMPRPQAELQDKLHQQLEREREAARIRQVLCFVSCVPLTHTTPKYINLSVRTPCRNRIQYPCFVLKFTFIAIKAGGFSTRLRELMP